MNSLYDASLAAAGTFFTHEFKASDDYLISVHAITVGAGGNFVGEFSNDGVNWVAVQGISPGVGGAAAAALTAANTMLIFYRQARYFRVRATAGTGAMRIVAGSFAGWSK